MHFIQVRTSDENDLLINVSHIAEVEPDGNSRVLLFLVGRDMPIQIESTFEEMKQAILGGQTNG